MCSESAQTFWNNIIAPKADGNTIDWRSFASAIWCEVLAPLDVDIASWRAIEPTVRTFLDKDGDGCVTVFEVWLIFEWRSLCVHMYVCVCVCMYVFLV